MYKEWRRKHSALAAVSDGQFGGTQVIQSLQFVLWKIGAWTVPARFHASFADKNYDEQGVPVDEKLSEKMAGMFVDELLWCMEVKRRMSEKGPFQDRFIIAEDRGYKFRGAVW